MSSFPDDVKKLLKIIKKERRVMKMFDKEINCRYVISWLQYYSVCVCVCVYVCMSVCVCVCVCVGLWCIVIVVLPSTVPSLARE